jgi:hypothetical protein
VLPAQSASTYDEASSTVPSSQWFGEFMSNFVRKARTTEVGLMSKPDLVRGMLGDFAKPNVTWC